MIKPDLEAVEPGYKSYIQERAKEVGKVLQSVPILNIDEFIENFDDSKVSYMGGGSKSEVYKLDGVIGNQTTTLKIFTEDYLDYAFSFDPGEVDEGPYLEYQGVKSVKFARDVCVEPDSGYGSELALRQIWGHAIGSVRMPEFIGSPVGIWISQSEDQTSPIVVGYSLPFIEGEAVMINADPELVTAADELKKEGIYVGSRGDSLNAIINPTKGIKKFIDVEVRF